MLLVRKYNSYVLVVVSEDKIVFGICFVFFVIVELKFFFFVIVFVCVGIVFLVLLVVVLFFVCYKVVRKGRFILEIIMGLEMEV